MKEEQKKIMVAMVEAEMYQIRNDLHDMANMVNTRIDLLRYKLKELIDDKNT